MTGTTIASTSSSSNTEPSPTESITNPTASSSTSSSPVLVDNHHHTLLSDDDDDEMTSSDDDNNNNNNYEDPLLQSPTEQEESNGNNTTTTTIASATPLSMIIQMILDRYSKWFAYGIQKIRNSKAPSLLRNTSQECMSWYVSFMASPHHHDKILKFLQYTFYMMSQVLLLVNSTSPQYSQQQKGEHHRTNHLTSSWLDKLYQEFTWARYILRILQLPIAMDAATHQSWTVAATPNGSSDNTSNAGETNQRQKLYNVLGRILTYSMVLYYPTELMAYLLWMKPKIAPASTIVTEVPKSALPTPSSTTTTTLVCRDNQNGYMISQYIYNFYTTLKRDPKNINHHSTSSKSLSWLSLVTPAMRCPPPETWSYISCRCWLIYVITELIQSYVQYKELVSLQFTKHTTTSEYRPAQQQIVLQTLRNLLFLIPCTTWSMPQWDTQPIVPLRTVNTLLWFESILSLYQAMIVHRNKNPTPPPPQQAPVEPNSTVDNNNTAETI